jgi:hypothetical protein
LKQVVPLDLATGTMPRNMTSIDAPRPIDTFVAAVALALAALAITAATWLFMNTGSMVPPGVLLAISWGLYPGLASYIAVRARSQRMVTAIAVVVPSLIQAAYLWSSRHPLTRFGIPLAVAAGVIVGMRIGTAMMARPGRGPLLSAVVCAGIAGVAVTTGLGFAALLLTPMYHVAPP